MLTVLLVEEDLELLRLVLVQGGVDLLDGRLRGTKGTKTRFPHLFVSNMGVKFLVSPGP